MKPQPYHMVALTENALSYARGYAETKHKMLDLEASGAQRAGWFIATYGRIAEAEAMLALGCKAMPIPFKIVDHRRKLDRTQEKRVAQTMMGVQPPLFKPFGLRSRTDEWVLWKARQQMGLDEKQELKLYDAFVPGARTVGHIPSGARVVIQIPPWCQPVDNADVWHAERERRANQAGSTPAAAE